MNKHLTTFYILTITQIVSIIGSAMTSIAIGIWLFTKTGDSTPVLLTSFFATIPQALAGSFAGVVADRWPRRQVLLWSDAGQAVGTVLLLVSFSSGHFQIWHLYAIAFLQGLLGMFQRPAMEASVTMLVPESHRDRANALRVITGPLAGTIAPVITGFIYAVVDVSGVIVIDLATFLIAVAVLWVVVIPQPTKLEMGEDAESMWQALKSGYGFLWQRPILLYLMLYAALLNFLLAGPANLTTPYILTLTGSEPTLGILLGALNAGIVVGGALMMIWGGTRPRIHGIMLGLLFRAFWLAAYGLVRTPLMLGVALFFIFFTNALVDGSFMSILQLKVPPHMQGRVFAALFQMMFIVTPLSLLVTGPLADRVFEPMVATPAWDWFVPIFGTEPGAGMGALITIAGLLMLALTAATYAHPAVRHVERNLPDHAPAPEEAP